VLGLHFLWLVLCVPFLDDAASRTECGPSEAEPAVAAPITKTADVAKVSVPSQMRRRHPWGAENADIPT
jgi:hypothetical protein